MESVNNHPYLYQIAEVQLVYKNNILPSQRPQISGSKDCYELLYQDWDKNLICLLEQFKVLLLNTANRVLGIYPMSSGGISGTVVDPRLLFATALTSHASGIILAHNHPSGNLQPSAADRHLTQKIAEGGKLLDIQVLDHLIITTEGYYSFSDEGLL
ncbi:MAG: JAB domain-containing protein [Chitinophagaceae bacterium]